MKTRLQSLIASEGLTSARLAEIAGVQPSTVSHILSGRNNPSFEFISNLLKAFPLLNSRWLLLGEGDIYMVDPDSRTVSLPESNYKKVIEEPAVAINYHDDKSDPVRPRPTNPANAFNSKCESPVMLNNKIAEKIVIFYSDGTFSIYCTE